MRVVPALDRGLAILELLSNGLIALGPQVFVLSSSYADMLDLTAVAHKVAHAVMKQCNETTQVGVLDGSRSQIDENSRIVHPWCHRLRAE